MREQPLDLRRSLAILRRRWFVLVLLAVLGMAGGFVYATRHVPQGQAAAEVLLPGTTASGAATTELDTQTQVIIATSGSVLIPTAASISPPIPVDQLEHVVSASAKSTNVLRIEARASTPERAVQIVSAVTKEYQNYVQGHKAVNGTTSLIQPPAAVPAPSKSRLTVKYSLLGLVAGLLVATIVVLFRARPDNRLRRRDQIAGAIGVPVLASMEAEQYKSIADWKRLLEDFDASAMNAWMLRPVLRSLVPADFDGQRTIRVVSFVGDKAALATGPELALFAAGSGIPTLLAPSDIPALEPLSAACAALRTSEQADRPLRLGAENQPLDGLVRHSIRWSEESGQTDADLVVSVVAVDPTNPELNPIPGPTILSVSSGFAVVDDLARVALASTKVGLAIDGIVVVNPDPSDATIGSFPAPIAAGPAIYGGDGHRGGGATTEIRSTTIRSTTNLTGRARWRA